MKCERCGSTHVVTINLVLGDGSPMEFSTCHVCESRTWRSNEERLSLRKVLQLTSTNKPR
jgi:hypothetical protein